MKVYLIRKMKTKEVNFQPTFKPGTEIPLLQLTVYKTFQEAEQARLSLPQELRDTMEVIEREL